jgi:hypothetical protein
VFSSRRNASCADVVALPEQISPASAANATAQALPVKPPDISTDIALAEILERVVAIVRERNDRLASEHRETAAMLTHMTGRLEEMASDFTESGGARCPSFDDAESLNVQVLSRVQELTDEVRIATELAPRRSLAAERLKNVADHGRDFRIRQERRLQDHTVRLQPLRAHHRT